MKKADVRLGATYTAKVSGRVVPVVLESESTYGGWNARNVTTGRSVRIKSAAKLRALVEPAPVVRDPVRATVSDVNTLRTARRQLEAQVEAGIDTPAATLTEARFELAEVEGRLREAEDALRDVPEAAYLFRPASGRKPKSSPQYVKQAVVNPPNKEANMARKSKAVQLEETLAELRRVEKLAGSTKWALEGAGAKKNPPSPERKAHLEAKLEAEQARIAELRAQRDELRG